MAYYILVFVFLKELSGGGEGDLVDVLVNLFGRHADSVVDDLESLFLLVQFDPDFQVSEFAVEFAVRGEGLHLLGRVHGVGHKFPQENLVVRIQKLLDDREYVLCRHPDLSCLCFICHIF